jgi:hypothetical protein
MELFGKKFGGRIRGHRSIPVEKEPDSKVIGHH